MAVKRTKYTKKRIPREHNHKSRCLICKLPKETLKTVEDMWVRWFSPEEIAEVVEGLVNNGTSGVYKSTYCLRRGLEQHAIFTGLEDKRLANWKGANKQVIRLGHLDIRGLAPKVKALLAAKAVESEARMAAPVAQPVNVSFQFGNVPTQSLEERARELLESVTQDPNRIDAEVKQIENKAENGGDEE